MQLHWMTKITSIIVMLVNLVRGMVRQSNCYKLISCDNPFLLALRVRRLVIMYCLIVYNLLCVRMIADITEDGKGDHFLEMERFSAFGVLAT